MILGHEQVDDFATETIDVHGLAAGEVLQPGVYLGQAAFVVWAIVPCLLLFFHEGRAARRTSRNENMRPRSVSGPRFEINPGDLWNDLPPLFHPNHIALPHIQFSDDVSIVQRSAFDNGAGNEDPMQVRDGRDGAGSADLVGNRLELGVALLSGELVGNGPAGTLRRQPQLALLVESVDFDHHAVGGEWQVVAVLFPVVEEVLDFIQTRDHLQHPLRRVGHLEAPSPEQGHSLGM